MTRFTLALAGAMALATPALAQTAAAPGAPAGATAPTGAIVGGQNNTGGGSDVTIPHGATGAETYQSNSAAAGNASQPERAVPQGSGGAGGSGGAN